MPRDPRHVLVRNVQESNLPFLKYRYKIKQRSEAKGERQLAQSDIMLFIGGDNTE